MNPQLTLLPKAPRSRNLETLRNPERYTSGDIIEWLATHYRGNKPWGGLWTSTHTPEEQYPSDWVCGLATNAAIKLAVPPAKGVRIWKLIPEDEISLITIRTLEEAVAFGARFNGLALLVPSALRQGPGKLITTCQTDWESALAGYDGIRLTAEAVDDIMWAHLHDGPDRLPKPLASCLAASAASPRRKQRYVQRLPMGKGAAGPRRLLTLAAC
jgi:hypothetical protein